MNTRPIGLIGAMDMEIEALAGAMEETGTETMAGLVFHQGTIEGVPCVVAMCGAGKVNAAVCAEAMVLRYQPRLVINVGVAGGVGVEIGGLVVADACVQYDFDTTAIDPTPLGTILLAQPDGSDQEVRFFPCDARAADILAQEAEQIYGGVVRGRVATGDAFVADKAKSLWLGEEFSARAVEMEGGSIAQVCAMNHIPCAVLRAISDNANDDAIVDFPAFARASSQRSAELLRRALKRL